MKTVDILVYHGKHADEYWLVDTPERLEAAQRKLFAQLDEWGCYGDEEEHVAAARAGDIQAIRWVLDIHNRDEYEGWDIVQACNPKEAVSPNNAEEGSLVHAAEQWMRSQGLVPPNERKHRCLFQAMLDDFSESEAGRDFQYAPETSL